MVEAAYDGRPMGRVRAVAFDFNGTLSHDEPIMCAIYERLFTEHGRPMTEAQYYSSLAGNTEESIIGGWLGVEGDELAALVGERIRRYREAVADGSTVPPALRDAVRHAAGRVPVAVVSGAFREEIVPVLDAAGVADLFTTLVTADDVMNGKPDPECYRLLVERLGEGIRPADVVVFEDTEAGIAAAKGAGVRCVAVRGTLPDERLSRADELVDAIDAELVRRLLG
jgi:beta-phosphoglucomutase